MRRLLATLALALAPATVGAETPGDPVRGEKVFARACAACHDIVAGSHRIGPHLRDLYGRVAGSAEGFAFSRHLTHAGVEGLVWTAETLDAYIANPRAMITGTRMNFRGLPDAAERRDLLAYLRTASAAPSDLPESPPSLPPDRPQVSEAVLAIRGDRDWGEYLSAQCTACHQRSGEDKGIPSITGWPERDFVLAMHAYRQKLRPHPVMQLMASQLSDEEIAALAAYFATIQ